MFPAPPPQGCPQLSPLAAQAQTHGQTQPCLKTPPHARKPIHPAASTYFLFDFQVCASPRHECLLLHCLGTARRGTRRRQSTSPEGQAWPACPLPEPVSVVWSLERPDLSPRPLRLPPVRVPRIARLFACAYRLSHRPWISVDRLLRADTASRADFLLPTLLMPISPPSAHLSPSRAPALVLSPPSARPGLATRPALLSFRAASAPCSTPSLRRA